MSDRITKFDPGRFREALARVKAGQGQGDFDPRPKFDPQQHADFVESMTRRHGFEAGDFKQVMEYYGFRWFEPHQCPPLQNGKRVEEGQWRSQRFQMAFANSDLLANFAGGPEEFDSFMKWEIRKQAAKAGLILLR